MIALTSTTHLAFGDSHLEGGQRHGKALLASEPKGLHDATTLDLAFAAKLDVVPSKLVQQPGGCLAHVHTQCETARLHARRDVDRVSEEAVSIVHVRDERVW
jgi:hypothetical protein